MSALFIVNPLSETVAKRGSLLASMSRPDNVELHTIDFSGHLHERLAELVPQGLTQIFIEGGDGTAQGVITDLLRLSTKIDSLPDIVLLPGGMTNQVAKTLGIRRRERDVRRILSGRDVTTTSTPLIRITSPDTPEYYGFLFSSGAVPMMTGYIKNRVHKRGIGGSLAVMLGIIKGISGRADDIMWPTDLSLSIHAPIPSAYKAPHLGTLVTTLPTILMGIDPFWGQDNAPLRLTYVDGTYQRLMRHVIGLWLGRKSTDRSADGLHSVNAHRLDFSYTGPVILDGEPLTFPDGEFSLDTTPALRFLR